MELLQEGPLSELMERYANVCRVRRSTSRQHCFDIDSVERPLFSKDDNAHSTYLAVNPSLLSRVRMKRIQPL